MTPALKFEIQTTVTRLRDGAVGYEEAVQEFKKQYVLEVLSANRCHESNAAIELGMHRNTLARKMREMGIALAEIKRQPRSVRMPMQAERRIVNGN